MHDEALPIDVGHIEFNRDTADLDGIQWSIASSEIATRGRGGALDPTGRHGSSSLPLFFGGGAVSMEGFVEAPTQALGFSARETLASLGIDSPIDVVWHEPVPKFLTVTRSPASPLINFPLAGLFAFELPFVAEFPFRRSLTSTTTALAGGSTVAITNAGTRGAYPVITTTSSGTVDLVIGGRHFTTGAVASGTVIDMWARTIRTGSGVDVSPWPKVPATEWLALPPGALPVEQAGTAGLSIVTYHTYA